MKLRVHGHSSVLTFVRVLQLLVALSLSGMADLQAATKVTITFSALDVVHYTALVDYVDHLELRAQEDDRPARVIDTLAGPTTVKGEYRLAADTKLLRLALGYVDSDGRWWPLGVNSYARKARITGTPDWGIASQPLALDGGDPRTRLVVAFDSLSIPAGREMTLKNMDFRAVVSGDTRYTVDLRVQGTLRFENCVFDGLLVTQTNAGFAGKLAATDCEFKGVTYGTRTEVTRLERVELKRCLFEGGFSLGGSTITTALREADVQDCLVMALTGDSTPPNVVVQSQCQIDSSEFYVRDTPDDRLDVTLDGAACSLTRNLFGTRVVVGTAGARRENTPAPSLDGNAFLIGLETLFPSTVSVAAPNNYWGSAAGPNAPAGWLSPSGSSTYGLVLPKDFLTTWTSGNPSSRTEPRPLFLFVRDKRVGQTTLSASTPPLMRQNRETLLCFDIGTFTPVIDGAQFWLEWDGRRVEPHVPPYGQAFRPYLDYANARLSPTRNAHRTLNFLVPADWTTGSLTHRAVLFADTSRVAQPPGMSSARLELGSADAVFMPAPKRPLRVGVVGCSPITPGLVPGWSSGEVNAEDVIALALRNKQQFVNLTLLEPREVRVDALAGTVFFGFAGVLFPGLETALESMLSAAIQLESYRWLLNAQIALTTPDAGYDVLIGAMPTNSMVGWLTGNVEGVRWPGTQSVLVDVSKPDAMLHEFGHVLGLYLAREQYDLPTGIDARGNQIIQTEGAVVQGVSGITRAPGRSREAAAGRPRHYPSGSNYDVRDIMGATSGVWVVPSTLRDLTTGLSQLLDPGSVLPDPVPLGSFRILLQGVMLKRPGTNVYELAATSIQSLLGTGRPNRIRGPSPVGYSWVALDAAGKTLVEERLTVVASTAPAIRWSQTFDVPTNSVHYEIRTLPGGQTVWSRTKADVVLPPTVQPPKVDNAAGTVDISWGGSPGAGLQAQRSTPSPTSLQHQLLVSAQPAGGWIPHGLPLTSHQVRLALRDLPAANPVHFKVVTSDGFTSAETVVDGPIVHRRPPLISILSPRDGDWFGPETTVTLEATIVDEVDGELTSAAWRSSIDGSIGTNSSPGGVRLSAGRHVLTVEAVNWAGVPSQASVAVVVGDGTTTDLRLEAGDLTLQPLGRDPWIPVGELPLLGATNRLHLLVHNQGITNRARVRLFLSLPNQAEQLIAERTFDWGPFESAEMQSLFVAATPGRYQVRAVLDSLGLPETNPTDNEQRWIFGGASPEGFEGWATAKIPEAGRRSPGDDPDNDGLVNYAEYAFGLDPLQPDTVGRPRVAIVRVSQRDYLAVTYRRTRPAASDAVYRATGSSSVVPWESAPVVQVGEPTAHDDFDEVTVRLATPMDSTASGFLRLMIAKP